MFLIIPTESVFWVLVQAPLGSLWGSCNLRILRQRIAGIAHHHSFWNHALPNVIWWPVVLVQKDKHAKSILIPIHPSYVMYDFVNLCRILLKKAGEQFQSDPPELLIIRVLLWTHSASNTFFSSRETQSCVSYSEVWVNVNFHSTHFVLYSFPKNSQCFTSLLDCCQLLWYFMNQSKLLVRLAWHSSQCVRKWGISLLWYYKTSGR